MNRAGLEAAYHGAHYLALLQHGELLLRVGHPEAGADRRLRREAGVRRQWAIVTPCNPGSRPTDASANVAALARLHAELRELGWRHVPSLNRDSSGRWPDEPGALLVDVAEDDARALGRRFGQNAIVYGRLGQAPVLLWL